MEGRVMEVEVEQSPRTEILKASADVLAIPPTRHRPAPPIPVPHVLIGG
jgi:hypothetical protein